MNSWRSSSFGQTKGSGTQKRAQKGMWQFGGGARPYTDVLWRFTRFRATLIRHDGRWEDALTYGIISLETGTALHWFDSETAAFAAARKILEGEPDALDTFGVARFDDSGHAVESWTGKTLLEASRGVPA